MKNRHLGRRTCKLLYSGGFTDNNDNYYNASNNLQTSMQKSQMYSQLGDTAMQGVAMIPGWGQIAALGYQGGKLLGNTIANKDQYGVASSDANAYIGGLLNPLDGLSNAGQAFSEGKILEGVGSLIPGVGSIFGRKRARNNREAFLKAEREHKAQIKLGYDKTALANYNVNGDPDSVDYFAAGGTMKRKRFLSGGNLKQIAPNVMEAQGASHEQGGIQVSPDAEIEGGELLTGEGQVLSDRLSPDGQHTFAQMGKMLTDNPKYQSFKRNFEAKKLELNKEIEKINKKEPDNRYARNTRDIKLGHIKGELMQLEASDPMNQLFELQEQFKQQQGGSDQALANQGEQIPTQEQMAAGGRFKRKYYAGVSGPFEDDPSLVTTSTGTSTGLNKGTESKSNNLLQYGSYFIDNVANTILQGQTPQIPKPEHFEAQDLNTKFNINPQLSALKTRSRSFKKAIDANSNSSQSTRAAYANANVDEIKATNDLLAIKENTETELKNKNLLNKQDVFNKNIEVDNNYRNSIYARRNAMLSASSANYGNLAQDAQGIIRDRNMAATDDKRVLMYALQFKDSGVARNLLGTPSMSQMINDGNYKQWEDVFKNDPVALERFYTLYGKK